jgi:polar amino acid transport system permease protein
MINYLGDLLEGLLVTFELSFTALGIGMILGLAAALARTYGRKTLSYIANAYIELIRGTPLTVQLFIIYFGLPVLGLLFSPTLSAIVALGINSGAYQAEYFRGAIESIGGGQMEAALSLGMSRTQAIRRIILPQAVRLALPSWSNEAAYLPKYSSVAFLVTVPELMARAKVVISENLRPLEVYLVVGLIYLITIASLSKVLDMLYEKYKFTVE